MSNEGVIYRISGPVVTATGMNAAMYDVVRVGHEGLMGEVMNFTATKQSYRFTKIPLVSDQVNQF